MSYNKKITEQFDLEGQNWRAFTKYPQVRGKYFISDQGRYKSKMKNGKFYYSLGGKKNGYYALTILYKGEKIAEPYMHDLVAEAFIGPMNDNEIVHHINENKTDNNIQNLRIQTASQHVRHHNEGKIQSEETKAKISLANSWRKSKISGKFLTKKEAKRRKVR